ncbi:VrrA/YqfQ family protein [Salsuginibacillus kocurii]|uniref:VrrA/YqfQ family protein n=1 Tax=Salsuginibacillus kocurii TaxID=427078 RepID=UPI00035C901D|nr:VrrA/YqfQ family protein [Salsuginibacillus kocurii]
MNPFLPQLPPPPFAMPMGTPPPMASFGPLSGAVNSFAQSFGAPVAGGSTGFGTMPGFASLAPQLGGFFAQGAGGAGAAAPGAMHYVQQAMKAAETAGPIIQKYGPMVKNLPLIFRMMKGMSGIGTSSGSESGSGLSSASHSIAEASTTPEVLEGVTPPPKLYI